MFLPPGQCNAHLPRLTWPRRCLSSGLSTFLQYFGSSHITSFNSNPSTEIINITHDIILAKFYRLREEQLSERLCVRCHQPFSLLFNRWSQNYGNRQHLCTSLRSLSLLSSSGPWCAFYVLSNKINLKHIITINSICRFFTITILSTRRLVCSLCGLNHYQ